jgi:hypothetical protein
MYMYFEVVGYMYAQMIRGLRTPMRNAQVGSEQNEFKPWWSNKVTHLHPKRRAVIMDAQGSVQAVSRCPMYSRV